MEDDALNLLREERKHYRKDSAWVDVNLKNMTERLFCQTVLKDHHVNNVENTLLLKLIYEVVTLL